MPTDPAAEISSLSAQLDGLVLRLADLLAEAGPEERSRGSAALLEVERHLTAARRELDRAARDAP